MPARALVKCWTPIVRNPEVSSDAMRRVEQRATQVMGDVTRTFDETMGKPQGLISIEEAIRTNARPKFRRAYDAAYATRLTIPRHRAWRLKNCCSAFLARLS